MTVTTIYTTLAVNGFFGVALIVAFEFFRLRHPDIFAIRARDGESFQPSKQLFGWVRQVFTIDDSQMLQLAGMDGYVYIRFLWMCSKLCGCCCAGALILMCVYGTAPGSDEVNGVDQFSMANIEQQGDRLWASFLFMYAFTGVFLYMIHKEYEHFAAMRVKFFSSRSEIDSLLPAQTKYTIIVENIPRSCRTSEKLRNLFEQIYPGEVLFAYVALECTALDNAVRERDAVLRRLENAFASFAADARGRRPKLFVSAGVYSSWTLRNYYPECIRDCCNSCCCCCQSSDMEEVDSLTFWGDQLTALCSKVHQLQEEAQAATFDPRCQQQQRMLDARRERDDRLLERKSSKKPRGSDGDSSIVSRSSSERLSNDALLLPATADSSTVISQRANSSDNLNRSSSKGNGTTDNGSIRSSVSSLRSLKNLDSKHVAAVVKGSVGGFWEKVLDMRDSVVVLSDTMIDARDTLAARLASATGFVTFRHRRTQLAAAHVPVLSEEYSRMKASSCPAPNDIIWENLWATTEHTETASYFTAVLYYIGLFFWSVVLAFVAALSTINKLDKYLNAMNLNDIERALVQGLLPSYLMMLLMFLLSRTMRFISRDIERQKTKSAVQMKVMQWFYVYQIANVYIFLLAGSIWQLLSQFIKDPAGIVTQISTELPSVAVFFMNYIITIWLYATPLSMLRPLHLMYLYFYKLCYPPIRVTRNMLLQWPFEPENIKYGKVLPSALYTLLIIQLYWVIAPLILFFGACYFISMYVVTKYMYAFTVVKQFESGGRFWFRLYKYSMIGLMASIIAGIAYMAVKEGIALAPALTPLPCIVFIAWRYTEGKFKSQSMNIPYDVATKEDATADGSVKEASIAVEATESKDIELGLLASGRFRPVPEQITASFTAEFIKQPNVVQPSAVRPYPHRIRGLPLFSDFGAMNDVYWLSEGAISTEATTPVDGGSGCAQNTSSSGNGTMSDARSARNPLLSPVKEEGTKEV